jgi:hypothetical protein
MTRAEHVSGRMEHLWSRAVATAGNRISWGASGGRSTVVAFKAKDASMGMLYAAIDIHKRVFQAAVLDPPRQRRDRRGELPAAREALHEWAMPLLGTVAAGPTSHAGGRGLESINMPIACVLRIESPDPHITCRQGWRDPGVAPGLHRLAVRECPHAYSSISASS